jgi:hypothetical protein
LNTHLARHLTMLLAAAAISTGTVMVIFH